MSNQYQQQQGFGVQPQQTDPRQWELAAGLAALPDGDMTADYMNEQQPDGQMVSGHYVAPAISQNMAALAKNYMGGQMYGERNKQTKALIDALRQNSSNGVSSNAQAYPVQM